MSYPPRAMCCCYEFHSLLPPTNPTDSNTNASNNNSCRAITNTKIKCIFITPIATRTHRSIATQPSNHLNTSAFLWFVFQDERLRVLFGMNEDFPLLCYAKEVSIRVQQVFVLRRWWQRCYAFLLFCSTAHYPCAFPWGANKHTHTHRRQTDTQVICHRSNGSRAAKIHLLAATLLSAAVSWLSPYIPAPVWVCWCVAEENLYRKFALHTSIYFNVYIYVIYI